MPLGTKIAAAAVFASVVGPFGGIGYLHLDKHLTNEQIEHIHDISIDNYPMDRVHEGHMYDVLVTLAGHGEKGFFRFPTIVELAPPSREYLYWDGRNLDIHFESEMPDNVSAYVTIDDQTMHMILPDVGEDPFHYPKTGYASQLAAAAKEYLSDSNAPATLSLGYDGTITAVQIPVENPTPAAHANETLTL